MIEIQHFSTTLGQFRLRDIDFKIEKQEIFAILGKTGSGKTVLLEAIAGFHQGQQGSIAIGGRDVREIPPEGRKIGFVYQDYGLFPHLSVLDNIAYGLKMNRVGKKQRQQQATAMAERLGIAHLLGRSPLTLSGGEQQRAALARALVLNPQLLLLDEPFSALDPKTKEQMYALIERIHGEFGCTILFVTHDFTEAQRLAHRVGIMIGGELRAVRSSEALFQHYEDEDICAFLL